LEKGRLNGRKEEQLLSPTKRGEGVVRKLNFEILISFRSGPELRNEKKRRGGVKGGGSGKRRVWVQQREKTRRTLNEGQDLQKRELGDTIRFDIVKGEWPSEHPAKEWT